MTLCALIAACSQDTGEQAPAAQPDSQTAAGQGGPSRVEPPSTTPEPPPEQPTQPDPIPPSAPVQPAATELGPDECLSTGTLEASLRPANVLFAIDRSASLSCNLPPITDSASCEQEPRQIDATQPSKWEVVRDAIGAAIEDLPTSASVAISYFSNDDRCGVQSTPHVPMALLEADQRTALVDSMAAVEPSGGTPIVGGLILAYKHLNPDQTPGLPFGNRFVVLVTDGEEGCAPEETGRLLEVELPKSRQARITTFVVGVPGSEVNRGFLSRLAFAGGAPTSESCDHESSDPTVGDCHFDMTRETDLAGSLQAALAAITEHALGCEFDLPEPRGAPVDYDEVNVVYTVPDGTQELVKKDDRFACDGGANGWQYNEDRSRVLICGEACNSVRRASSIRIALGCRSVVVE